MQFIRGSTMVSSSENNKTVGLKWSNTVNKSILYDFQQCYWDVQTKIRMIWMCWGLSKSVVVWFVMKMANQERHTQIGETVMVDGGFGVLGRVCMLKWNLSGLEFPSHEIKFHFKL